MTLIGWAAPAVLLVLLTAWFFWRRTERVPCRIDLERTHEHLHAHVELLGFLPEPGDSVRVEDDFVTLDYGTTETREAEAVVTRASALRRAWTRFTGRFEFYELYDVGFE
ncbi:hypothetical protein BH23GEM11_BH23GEM11_09220 [soil metagenome]